MVLFCADLLQEDLDNTKEYWNSHRIRKSKHAAVSGVPDVIIFYLKNMGKQIVWLKFQYKN